MEKENARPRKSESLRQRAEKIAQQHNPDLAFLSRDDIERLAHEFAIHQIELEMQNEDLRQTQARLEDARNRYADLYDFAPIGYLTLDKANLVIEANLTVCNMLGLDRSDLLEKRISDYIAPKSQDEFYFSLREIRRTGTKKSCELKMIKTDGSNFYAQFEGLPAREDALRAIILDISEQRKAKDLLNRANADLEFRVEERTKELRKSEEKYRRIIETANEGIWIVGPDDKTLFVNEQMARMLGYTPEEMLGRPSGSFVATEQQKKAEAAADITARGEGGHYEFKLRCKDGSYIWTIVSLSPLLDESGQFIGNLGMNSDITELKRAEHDLKDYARRIVKVQEEERKRIAFELHDDTAQYLAILKLQLDSLVHSGQIQSPELLKKLQYLEKDAGRAVDDIRRYSHELRPGVLEHLGLLAALEQIAEDINKLEHLTVSVEAEGEEPELSEEVKLGFFRIAQEAMNNCRKHAKASKALITLNYDKHRVKMSVTDNGVGFDMKLAANDSKGKGSLGMMSMRERAGLIGANLKIESQPGQGTSVSVELPL